MHFKVAAQLCAICLSLGLFVAITASCHHRSRISTTVPPSPLPSGDSEIKRLSEQIDELLGRVSVLARSLAAVKSDAATSQANLAEMRADLKAAEDRLAELNSKNQQMAERQAAEREIFARRLEVLESINSRVRPEPLPDLNQRQLDLLHQDLEQTRAAQGKVTKVLRSYEEGARLNEFSIRECETEAEAQFGLLVPAQMEVGVASEVHVNITKDLSASMRQRLRD